MRRIAAAVAVLAALELALRLGGLAYLARQRWSSGAGYWERGATRILCLGESTTAGGPTSYPAQLEVLLNEGGGRRFAVVNRGLPGTDTEAILAALPDDLERYAPDVVVVMMGINDGHGARLVVGPARGWRSLRVVKLARLLFGARPEVSTWGVPDDERRRARALQLASEIEKADSPAEAAGKKGVRMLVSRRYAEAEPLLRRAAALEPRSTRWAGRLAEALAAQGRAREAAAVLRRALTFSPDDGDLARDLADVEWTSLGGKRRGPPQPDPLDDPETARRYLELAALVERAGAKLVAVQYPMRPAAPLASLLGSRVAAVVDNEASFKRALAKGRPEDLFVDLFAGDFGHCTAAGNRLLAADVARAVLAAR